jgi:hypothetical protein
LEVEITFRKRFQIREDQDPADIGKMYIETMGFEVMYVEIVYDPNYGDDVLCECGHKYYRHFDTYEEMSPVGCKYCMHSDDGKYGEIDIEGTMIPVCSGFKKNEKAIQKPS